VSNAAESVEPILARVHYEIVEKDDERYLVSATSPNLKLFISRDLSATAQTKKKFPRQSIFLDGMFSEAPFLDNEARQYSLDHHSGCIRGFTLSTCEQAVVMLLQGLPLDENEWHVYINEPDLDAVLAAWVLLNHVELVREGSELLRTAMPIIRVEGVIDAHGLQMGILTALPRDVYDQAMQKIDGLLVEERRLKASGEWVGVDLVAYTQRLLDAVDRLLFPAGHLEEVLSTELIEVARAPIQQNKFALLCRSRRGIYAVETELKRRYERQLAVIILDQGEGRYTLRQIDPFLPRTLDHAYRALNGEDQNVRADNRWGGSQDIGGSPRGTGTALEADMILRLIAEEYASGDVFKRAWVLLTRFLRRWRASRKSPGPPLLPSGDDL
jgi:hypothetical protein